MKLSRVLDFNRTLGGLVAGCVLLFLSSCSKETRRVSADPGTSVDMKIEMLTKVDADTKMEVKVWELREADIESAASNLTLVPSTLAEAVPADPVVPKEKKAVRFDLKIKSDAGGRNLVVTVTKANFDTHIGFASVVVRGDPPKAVGTPAPAPPQPPPPAPAPRTVNRVKTPIGIGKN